jgi:hypothetical protein
VQRPHLDAAPGEDRHESRSSQRALNGTEESDEIWAGQPVEVMARDVRVAYDKAAAASAVKTVIPVGDAWTVPSKPAWPMVRPASEHSGHHARSPGGAFGDQSRAVRSRQLTRIDRSWSILRPAGAVAS